MSLDALFKRPAEPQMPSRGAVAGEHCTAHCEELTWVPACCMWQGASDKQQLDASISRCVLLSCSGVRADTMRAQANLVNGEVDRKDPRGVGAAWWVIVLCAADCLRLSRGTQLGRGRRRTSQHATQGCVLAG